jgi:hypothetical protein
MIPSDANLPELAVRLAVRITVGQGPRQLLKNQRGGI